MTDRELTDAAARTAARADDSGAGGVFVVCVHATPRAIPPTHRMFARAGGDFRCRDLVDERLFTCGDDEHAGREAFFETLHRAEADTPAAILTTCSMYTRHLPAARQTMAIPIVGVDEPMIEQAARRGGPFALVGSLSTAIALTEQQIRQRAANLGTNAEIAETRLVPADACATEDGTRRLADELREVGARVRTVVVVQLSLSGVDDLLSDDERCRILTSAHSALDRLRAAVREKLKHPVSRSVEGTPNGN